VAANGLAVIVLVTSAPLPALRRSAWRATIVVLPVEDITTDAMVMTATPRSVVFL
jgi:hypothetical protein